MAEVLGNATKGPYTLFAPTNFAFSKLGYSLLCPSRSQLQC